VKLDCDEVGLKISSQFYPVDFGMEKEDWLLKKFRIVFSMTEAEYVALCESKKDVFWTRRLLASIGYKQLQPTALYCDNHNKTK
jgi:hypothetical protein